jgi:20S proteasome alpha/beta subunit
VNSNQPIIQQPFQELEFMTWQVGLVGTDGIVLAGDRRILSRERGQQDDFNADDSTKFYTSEDAVCCWAGEVPAHFACQNIQGISWQHLTHDQRKSALEDCGKRGWITCHGTGGPSYYGQVATSKVLVGFANDELWELEVFGNSKATKVTECVVSGGATTCRHITRHYIPENASAMDLAVIAAHSVLMAGKENPFSISGLEVAIFPSSGPYRFLDSNEIQGLIAASSYIEESIKKLFSRPVTPAKA